MKKPVIVNENMLAVEVLSIMSEKKLHHCAYLKIIRKR